MKLAFVHVMQPHPVSITDVSPEYIFSALSISDALADSDESYGGMDGEQRPATIPAASAIS